MAQHYSNPARENEPHALPDIETFYVSTEEAQRNVNSYLAGNEDAGVCIDAGWYWQSCFPGCVPDSEPYGPFATEDEALEDAREGMEE